MNVLLWDIETSPLVVAAWGLHKQYLNDKAILKESHLICAAWKWLDSNKVYAACVKPAAPEDDRELVERLHTTLGDADVLVGHNGDKFDLKRFNARAIFHGLPPLPPVPTIDTLKVARKHFGFTSNRLDYLGHFLGLGRKIDTDFQLWLQAMVGHKAALNEMVKYNKQDVLLLERVYTSLRPYMTTHPNVALYKDAECCPNCGSVQFHKQGLRYSRTVARQKYQCDQCRGWFQGAAVRTVKLS